MAARPPSPQVRVSWGWRTWGYGGLVPIPPRDEPDGHAAAGPGRTTGPEEGIPVAPGLTGSPRVGGWIDRKGFLHQKLTAEGRYDETRGGRSHAFQGRPCPLPFRAACGRPVPVRKEDPS